MQPKLLAQKIHENDALSTVHYCFIHFLSALFLFSLSLSLSLFLLPFLFFFWVAGGRVCGGGVGLGISVPALKYHTALEKHNDSLPNPPPTPHPVFPAPPFPFPPSKPPPSPHPNEVALGGSHPASGVWWYGHRTLLEPVWPAWRPPHLLLMTTNCHS